MDIAIALAVGLIIGAGGVWFVREREMWYLRKEASGATDRLVHAWRDDPNVVIPPRETEQVVLEALPPDLKREVDQWEDPVVRAETEATIRSLMGQGLGQAAILKTFER